MDDLTKLVRETRDILDRMERRIAELSTHIDWATHLDTHSALDPIDINAFSKPIVHKVTMPPSAPKEGGKAITIPAEVWEGFQRAVNGTHAPTEMRSWVERRKRETITFPWDIPTGETFTSSRDARLFWDKQYTAHTCRRVAEADRRKP